MGTLLSAGNTTTKVAAAGGLVIGIAIAWWWGSNGSGLSRNLIVIAVTLATFGIISVSWRRRWRQPEALFHPLAGPLVYLTYALLIPQIYMMVTGNGIGSIPNSTLTAASVSVMCLTVLSFVSGIALARSIFNDKPTTSDTLSSHTIEHSSWGFLVAAGRILLLIAFIAKLFQALTEGSVFTSVYGANQLSYDFGKAVAVAGEGLIPIGCIMVMHGNVAREHLPLRIVDGVLLGAVLAVSVVFLGSRADAIAPAILFAWFWVRSGRTIGWKAGLAAIGIAGVAFLAIWRLRNNSTGGNIYPLWEQLLWQSSSPQLVTGRVTELVPASADFYFGSTYLHALINILPGPISRAILGDVSGTGALVYRQLIDFQDPNQGFGFAFPAEAYLNFGYVGVGLISAFTGALFYVAYRWAYSNRTAVAPIVYPLLLSYLPYGLRSDFLSQLKNLLYPVLFVAIVFLVLRHWPGVRRRASRTEVITDASSDR